VGVTVQPAASASLRATSTFFFGCRALIALTRYNCWAAPWKPPTASLPGWRNFGGRACSAVRQRHQNLVLGRCASDLGTAGVLLEARVRRRLTLGELETALRELCEVLWLSPAVVAEIMRLARETDS